MVNSRKKLKNYLESEINIKKNREENQNTTIWWKSQCSMQYVGEIVEMLCLNIEKLNGQGKKNKKPIKHHTTLFTSKKARRRFRVACGQDETGYAEGDRFIKKNTNNINRFYASVIRNLHKAYNENRLGQFLFDCRCQPCVQDPGRCARIVDLALSHLPWWTKEFCSNANVLVKFNMSEGEEVVFPEGVNVDNMPASDDENTDNDEPRAEIEEQPIPMVLPHMN